MGSKTVKTTSKETGTTTPNVPGFAMPGIENYYGQVSNLLNSDWQPYTAPNAVQQGVYDNAGGMRPGSGYMDFAAKQIMNMGNSAGQVGDRSLAGATFAAAPNMSRADLGGTYMAGTPTMQSPTLGGPATVDMRDAINKFSAQKADKIEYLGGAGATGGRASTYMKDYLNPFTDLVAKQALIDYDDDAGRSRAAYSSDVAKRGGYGGSRSAIGAAQLEGQLARGRASTDIGLRSLAWDKAIQAGAGDAGNETSASIASANNATQANISQNQLEMQRNLFDAETSRLYGLQSQGLLGQAALANAGYKSQYDLARYGNESDSARLVYGTQADIGKHNSSELNDASLARYGQESDNNRLVYQTQNERDMTRYGQESANNALVYQTGTANDRFNVDAELAQRGQNLNAAGLLGDIGGDMNADARADAGAQLDIGNALYQIQQRQDLAPAAKLQMIQELLTGGGLLGTITGQSMTSEGTNTRKESGGLLRDMLMAAMANASKIGSMGG